MAVRDIIFNIRAEDNTGQGLRRADRGLQGVADSARDAGDEIDAIGNDLRSIDDREVSIDVDVDVDDTEIADAEAAIDRLPDGYTDIKVDASEVRLSEDAIRSLPDGSVGVAVDTGEITAAETDIRALPDGSVDVDVGRQQITDAESQLLGMRDPSVDTQVGTTQITDAENQLLGMRDPSVTVQVDTSQITAAENRIRGIRDALIDIGVTDGEDGIGEGEGGGPPVIVPSAPRLPRLPGAVGGAITAAVGVAGANDVAEMTLQLEQLSAVTGISIETLDKYRQIIKPVGGEIRDISEAARTWSEFIGQAARGSEGDAERLTELGISLEDVINIPAEQQFEILINRLQEMGNTTERAELVNKSYSTDLHGLLAIVDRSPQSLGEMADSIEAAITAETIQQTKDYQDGLLTVEQYLFRVKQAALETGAALSNFALDPSPQTALELGEAVGGAYGDVGPPSINLSDQIDAYWEEQQRKANEEINRRQEQETRRLREAAERERRRQEELRREEQRRDERQIRHSPADRPIHTGRYTALSESGTTSRDRPPSTPSTRSEQVFNPPPPARFSGDINVPDFSPPNINVSNQYEPPNINVTVPEIKVPPITVPDVVVNTPPARFTFTLNGDEIAAEVEATVDSTSRRIPGRIPGGFD